MLEPPTPSMACGRRSFRVTSALRMMRGVIISTMSDSFTSFRFAAKSLVVEVNVEGGGDAAHARTRRAAG